MDMPRLPNRIHSKFEIQARFEGKQRYGLSFGVLFMDIDYSKNFNDQYGRDTGDQVLKVVANTMKAASRPFDTHGR